MLPAAAAAARRPAPPGHARAPGPAPARAAALALALALAATPLSAQETCPGPGAPVIVVGFDDMVIHFLPLADGSVMETEHFAGDAPAFQYRVGPSGLIIEAWEVGPGGTRTPGSAERYVHDGPDGPPPLPAPELRWSGTETFFPETGGPEATPLTVAFGSPGTRQIGPCSYASLPVTVLFPGAEPWASYSEVLPDLGITLFLGGDALGQAPDLVEPRWIATRPRAADAPDVSEVPAAPPAPPPAAPPAAPGAPAPAK